MNKPKLPTPKEAEILRQCLAYLTLAGIVHWRNNSGGTYLPGGNGRRQFVRFGARGSSDILGVLPPSGRLLAVECKRRGAQPTDDQRAFIERVRSAGGLALVVHDVSDLRLGLRIAGYEVPG